MNPIVLVPLAAAVGLVMGTLGGGGAILTVPILVYLAGLSPHAATSGSLLIVAVSAAAGAAPHLRRGNVRLRDGLVFGALGSVGAIGGSRLSSAVPERILLTAFAALLVVVAAVMIRKFLTMQAAAAAATSHGSQQASQPPDASAALRTSLRHRVALVVTATCVGLLTGFFGVGGGFVVVPALTLVLGFTMPVAVGTSLVVIMVNCVVALGSRIVLGAAIDWPVTLIFAAAAVLGSLLGARLSARISAAHLTGAFAALLACVAGFMMYRSVFG